MQPIIPESPRFPPTERSIPDVIITTVMPIASIAFEDTCDITFIRFWGVKKYGELRLMIKKNTRNTPSMASSLLYSLTIRRQGFCLCAITLVFAISHSYPIVA
jgi:hypothetical protein